MMRHNMLFEKSANCIPKHLVLGGKYSPCQVTLQIPDLIHNLHISHGGLMAGSVIYSALPSMGAVLIRHSPRQSSVSFRKCNRIEVKPKRPQHRRFPPPSQPDRTAGGKRVLPIDRRCRVLAPLLPASSS